MGDISSKVVVIIDKLIYICLILFALTFYIDIPINFLVIGFIFCLIKYSLIKQRSEFNSKHLYVILFFITMILLSVIFNDQQSFLVGIKAYKSQYISPLAGLGIFCFFDLDKKRAQNILSIFCLILLINAVIAIYYAHNGILVDANRAVGIFDDKMLLAAAHMLILPMLLAIIVFVKNLPRRLKYFYEITLLFNIPAVILANTRIVWIGLLISFILILIIGVKNKIKAISSILCIALFAMAVIYINPTSRARLYSISNLSINYQTGYQSNRERMLMWHSALTMFVDHPLVGVGLNNFHNEYLEKYKDPTAIEPQWHAHNVFLNTLAETGIVGFIGLMSLLIYLYYDVLKSWRENNDIVAKIYFFSLLTFSINFLTDVLFCGHYLKLPTYIFWLITGMYISLSRYAQIKKE